jgi:hypothetical protein
MARALGGLLLLTAALSVAGCGYLTLRNPSTGATVTCGRIPITLWKFYDRALAEVYDELACAEMAQSQGYIEDP